MPKTYTDDAEPIAPETKVATDESTSAETKTLVTATSGTKTRVTALDAFCDNANTNDTAVEFKFGTTTIRKHPGIAPGSGYVVGAGAGVIVEVPDNTALQVTVENPGGTVTYAVTYHQVDA